MCDFLPVRYCDWLEACDEVGRGGDNAMIRWTGVQRVEVAIGVISITIARKCTGEVDVLQ